jgi:hypothetical protein
LALAHYRDLFRPEAVLVEPFKRMVAHLVEFYRCLAAFSGVRGSYEQPAPARNVGLRGAPLTARRALNNPVHPFALQFERGALRRSAIVRSFAHFGEVLIF